MLINYATALGLWSGKRQPTMISSGMELFTTWLERTFFVSTHLLANHAYDVDFETLPNRFALLWLVCHERWQDVQV